MKKWFKLLAVIIAICTAFGQTALAAEGTETSAFSDINGHWCRETIEKFNQKGWAKGYEDGSFKPDKLIGRAEFTAMVVRILNKLDEKKQCSFKDVKSDDWFYSVVASASKEKYVEGYEDNTFRPFQNMTRQEIAVFVKRLLNVVKLSNGKSINFKDESEIASWATESVTALTSNNVISGYPDGTFKPSRYTTRAEAVKMLDVTLKIIEDGVPNSGDVNKSETPKKDTTTQSAVTSGGSSGDSQVRPTADFDVQPTYLRDSSKGGNASIKFRDKSYGGVIRQRIWKVRYDSNDDGKFEDEKCEVVDSNNNTAPIYVTNRVGNYQAELQVTKGSNYDTDTDYNKNNTVKTFTVDNAAPKAAFDLQKKKKLDVIFTIGKTDSDKVNTLNSKIEEFQKACQDNNIDAKISTVSTQSLTASDSFNWQEYDHYNYRDTYSATLPKHITIDGKNIKMIGYSWAPLKDFLFVPDTNKTQKTFTFDLKRDTTDWHSMEGGGFLFNASINNGKLSGFCVLITQEGLKLDQLDGVDIEKFRNGTYNLVENAGRRLSTYNIGNPYANHSFKIVVDPNSMSLWDGGKLIVDNYILPANNYGSGFGPITSHIYHGCSQMSYFTFTNIIMTSVIGKSLSEVLDKPDWRLGSERALVNLSDDEVYELKSEDKVADVAGKLLKSSVDFIGIGTGTNKAQYDSVVNGIAGNGLYIDGADVGKAMEDLQSYILNKVNNKDYKVGDYIEKGEEILSPEIYSDPENDPEFRQQWKYVHDNSVFENNDGKAAFDGNYLAGPIETFDKTGKYTITLKTQDNPVGSNEKLDKFRKWSDEKLSEKTITVHSKPVAQLSAYMTTDTDGTTCVPHVIENCYDPDHKDAQDQGIVLKELKWKNVKDSVWTEGNLPDKLKSDENYILMLRVKDKEGSFSDPAVVLLNTNNTGILNPTITSFPVASGKEGEPYSYTVTAVCAPGESLSYSLAQAPEGMKIDKSSGVISWIPSSTQSGENTVTVVATDTKNRSGSQTFIVNVEEAINSSPVITSTPVTSAKEGEAYVYNVVVVDQDNDPLVYSLAQAPIGMTIKALPGVVNKPQTCVINWTPSGIQAGKYEIAFKVEDGRGGVATQNINIDVAEAINTNPVISSAAITAAKEGVAYTYNVAATDADNDILAYSLATSPAGMTIDEKTGVISWTPSHEQAGKNNVTVKVTDGREGEAMQSFTIDVEAVAANSQP